MSLNERVYEILAEAAADAVEGSPGTEPSIGPELLLVGEGSELDSLGLVSLIVTAETKIQEEFGVSIALVDGAVMDSQESKFAFRQILYIPVGWQSLNLILPGIQCTELSLKCSGTNVMKELSSWLGNVIGSSYYDNTLRINKLAINHSNQFNRFKDNKADLCLRQMGSVLEHCPTTGN